MKDKNNIECEQFDIFTKKINELIEDIKKDAIKFYNNDNKAAGLRFRKGLKEIKFYVHEVIKESLIKEKNDGDSK